MGVECGKDMGRVCLGVGGARVDCGRGSLLGLHRV